MNKPIGENEIRAAAETLKKYKAGKQSLESRIISNEQWWKMRHWGEIAVNDADTHRVKPTSAWLFNSIANKHADAMDNYPEPSVLPREEGDKDGAKMLSDILPVILEHNDFQQVYNDGWWYKLKAGTMCMAVTWDSTKDNGLGDVAITNVDLLNLFWEPGKSDIQQSRNVFYVSLEDNDILTARYPELKGKVGGTSITLAKYKSDDTIDTSDKSAVVDWYYKKWQNNRCVLHFCKFCGDTLLYASENDPNLRDRGFYDHGKYPFILDTLFKIEGSACGFGYIDIMKDSQMYIDKLNQVVLEHTVQLSRKRFFIKQNSAVREDEFADFTRSFVHVAGNITGEDIREIKLDPLDSAVFGALNSKIEELKETSGNRDFSQGGTASGVTAASAIAALQEAGSKLSRDMLKSSYKAFVNVCYFIIELIRQFYDEPRSFRIIGSDGAAVFRKFDNRQLKGRQQGEEFGVSFGERKPIFDVVCKASKKSPFSKAAQNELAKEMYGMGFFNPEMADQVLCCLELMDFDGKDTVLQKIGENSSLHNRITALQQEILQLRQLIGYNGTMPQDNRQPMPSVTPSSTDGVTRAVMSAVDNSVTNTARDRAQSIAEPK